MKFRLRSTLIFALSLLSTPGWAQTARGGDISGGGSGCLRSDLQERAFLLDFSGAPSKLPTRSAPGSEIPVSPTMRRLGFQWIGLESLPAMRVLRERLAVWRSPETNGSITRIESMMSSLILAATPFRIGFRPRALPGQERVCPVEQTFTAAVYFNQRVMISIPAWNQLDLISQAGLILHEALRHAQLTRNGDQSDESEGLIRLLVSRLLLFDPEEDRNFDFRTVFEDVYFSSARRRRREANQMRDAVCPTLARGLSRSEFNTGLELLNRVRRHDCGRNAANRQPLVNTRGFCSETANPSDGTSAFELTYANLQEAARSFCMGRLGPGWAEPRRLDVYRLMHFFQTGIAAINSPAIRKDDLMTPATMASYLARWYRLSDKIIIVYASIDHYETLQFFELMGSIQDITRSFQSLATGMPLRLQLPAYVEGRLRVSSTERAQLEQALDELRTGMEELLRIGVLVH